MCAPDMEQLSLHLTSLHDGDVMGSDSIIGETSNMVGVGIQVEEEEEDEENLHIPDVVSASEMQNIRVSSISTMTGVPGLRVELASDERNLISNGLPINLTDSDALQVTSIEDRNAGLILNQIEISGNKTSLNEQLQPLLGSTINSVTIPEKYYPMSRRNNMRNISKIGADMNEAVQSEQSLSNTSEADDAMITIVDSEDLEASPSTLVHHVNESTASQDMDKPGSNERSNDCCFLCGAKLAVSARGAVDLLDPGVVSSHCGLPLTVALSEALHLQETLSATSPFLCRTSLLCRKCFRQLEEQDSLQAQLSAVRKDMCCKFLRDRGDCLATQPLKEEPLIKEEDTDLMDGDTEFKLSSAADHRSRRGRCRGRGRGGRGRFRGRPPASFRPLIKKEPGVASDEWAGEMERIEVTISTAVPHDTIEVTGLDSRGNTTSTITTSSRHRFLDGYDNGEAEDDDSAGDEDEGGTTQRLAADVITLDCLDVCDEGVEQGDEDMSGMLDTSCTARTLFALPKDTSEAAEPGWQRYSCHYCHATAKLYQAAVEHIRQCHPDQLYSCECCNALFPRRSQLLQHLDSHLCRSERCYACDSCSKRFVLPRLLRQHRRHHLAKSVLCPHCPRRFRSEPGLQEHLYTHSGCKPFQCEHCSKRFASRYALKLHARTHQVRERNHKCSVCHKEFLSIHHLLEHMNVHQDVKKYMCEACGKAFATLRSLDLHKVIHSGVKNYSCRTCHKQFARKGEVEDHERTHTGEKPFQCEVCGATFSQRSNLQSHRRATHLKEKKHHCKECNKAFKRRRLLVYHMMSVHTGERPYKCNDCTASFVYPEHYKKHLRTHTGEKPFRCDVCDKAFNSRDNRNAHKFTHTERKPYECMLCNAGFMRKPMLMTHLSQHGALASQPELYVRVNPPNVADEKVGGACPAGYEGEEDGVQLLEGMESSRPVHIIEADELPRYLLQTERGPFLASVQGQVVEVRDALHYQLAEGEGDPLSGVDGVRAFHLQLSHGEDTEELQLQSEAVDNSTFLSRSFTFEGQVMEGGGLGSLRTVKVVGEHGASLGHTPTRGRGDGSAMWTTSGDFIGNE